MRRWLRALASSKKAQFWLGTLLVGGLAFPVLGNYVQHRLGAPHESEQRKQTVQLLIAKINEMFDDDINTIAKAEDYARYFRNHKENTRPSHLPDGFDNAVVYAERDRLTTMLQTRGSFPGSDGTSLSARS